MEKWELVRKGNYLQPDVSIDTILKNYRNGQIINKRTKNIMTIDGKTQSSVLIEA